MADTMGDYLVVPGFGAGTPNRKKEIAGKLLSRKPEERRKWLENADEALGYYLGPHAGQSVQKLGQLMNFTDAGDYAEAVDASRALWNQPNFDNSARYATAAAAMMIPALSARMVNGSADVLGDAIASGADDVRRFVGDESGAIKAFHGSPHDFDKFSMDKIGTGEGAQAYGHGLYFAENEAVAREYRDALRFPRIDNASNAADRVRDDLNYHRGNVEGLRSIYQGMIERGDDAAKKMGAEKIAVLDKVVQETPGRMYEVNINANPDDFLDWDKPLSEQSQKVRDALINTGGASESAIKNPALKGDYAAPTTDFGRDAYVNAGIPGIKYLDQGSRGAGEGSRNFVVFDDKLISIVRKYGIPGAAAMLGVSAQEVEAAMNDGRAAEIQSYLDGVK